MPYKRPIKGKSEEYKNVPSNSLARPDSPTKGFDPKCRTVVGLNDVEFQYSEHDLFTIKSRVALYRLGKMLEYERQADGIVKKDLTEFTNEQDKADFKGKMNTPEHHTVLVKRMLAVAINRMNEKGAQYNILRQELKELDDAFERKDSRRLTTIMAQYDEEMQEKFKSETDNRSMDFTLVNMYISNVLIPNNWMFRGAPDVAEFEAFHPKNNYWPAVRATAQLARIVEDREDDERSNFSPAVRATAQLAQIIEDLEVEDDESSRKPHTARLSRIVEDQDEDKRRSRNFSRLEKGKYRKIDNDDDGTVTETEDGRKKQEVRSTSSKIGSDDDGTVTETDHGRRKQEVRRSRSNHPTAPDERKSGRTNGMAKKWR